MRLLTGEFRNGVYIKLVNNMGKLDIHFKDWFLSMVRNFFLENWHKSESFEEICDEIYQLQDITQAINELNEELKIPFSLYLSGCKYEEIGDHLDLPLGTVKSRIFFAKEQFRSRLKAMKYSNN